ncbi:aspartate/glutamate racemase family protein [Bosea sp. 47.2.35]|uniref:aspartate/glutamate racemase family protein n=1 Tax=Bosea sp. 47.2.35 TaxID=2969304 RepID=UPI0021503AFC|nr:aspartate/glutamate racemase family protein [Bosea sp. 47.2.35]MCR4524003.1 aspartate/glutamate racemase family protein [Bosea sp. 47.2.35]
MSGTIYVINPNSTERVTREIDIAVAPLRMEGGPAIECLTLADGPPGIQSQRDVDGLIPALLKRAAGLENEAAAFVVACFSDPGMHALREQSTKPVLGIAECGVLTALTLGQRFGIVAMLQNSIARHLRYLGAMGMMSRFAGDLPVNLTIAEMADDDLTLGRMIAVGKTLRDTHHADVLVMGCAGMARFRDALERELGLPIVEPTQAAVTMAIGRVRLGWTAALFDEG